VGELCEDAALGDRVRSCYEGRAENFLEATDAEAERLGERPAKIREEAFLDVSLDVEAEDGTVEGALQRYLEPEILDGENRWASPAGRCAARKGVRFARLPPAIVLHLKRFAYDYMRDEVRKVGAPLRVPFRLPAAAFERAAPVEAADAEEGEEAVAPAGAEEAPDDDRDPYLLHAVVVHVGGGRGGHYYAYVDPLLDGRWVKFDDDRVSAADARVVAAEAAGAELGGGNSVGAYLLQYVRASAAPRLGLRGGAAEL
jgi:ubiquitin carboxyl-terminal hydrolase 7